MSLFGDDDKVRKMLVVFDYIARYCPKALREMTKVAVANNVRYNPGRAPNDINWARDKSKDQLGSLFRHMLERRVDGKIFEPIDPEIAKVVGYDRVYVLAEAAWRAVAALELDIEAWETAEKAQELECGCPSHHEHGPGGAAGCPVCTPGVSSPAHPSNMV